MSPCIYFPDDDLVLPEDAVDEQLGEGIAPPIGPKAEVDKRPLPEKRARIKPIFQSVKGAAATVAKPVKRFTQLMFNLPRKAV